MSLNLFRGLMPAEEAFTPLFCQQAELILRAVDAGPVGCTPHTSMA